MFCYGFNSGDLYVIASGDFCTSQCLAMNYRIFKLSLVKFTVNHLAPRPHPTFRHFQLLLPGFTMESGLGQRTRLSKTHLVREWGLKA